MTTTDRTGAPDEAFEVRLLGWEARPEVDIAADVAEERVAYAMVDTLWERERWIHEIPAHPANRGAWEAAAILDLRTMARAALAAIPEASR